MKTQFIHLCFAVSVILLGFVVASCKKEKSETIAATTTQSDEQLVNNVHWFMDAAKDVKEGKILKSGEKMLVDSAVYYIGSTLNYKYGFANTKYEKLLFDTVMVSIPYIASEGKTFLIDALEGYNLTIQNIKGQFQGISNSKKSLIACVVQNAGINTTNNTILVRVIAQFGVGQAPDSPTFEPDEAYWWELDSYKCDLSGSEGAANVFENDINFVMNIAPPPGVRYTFTDVQTEKFIDPTLFENPDDNGIDNFCDYQLFYATTQIHPNNTPFTFDEKCLGIDAAHPGIHEMDYYRTSTREVLQNFLVDHNRNFISVLIISPTDNLLNGVVNIRHEPWLTYGIRHISNELSYPVTLEY